MSMSDFGRTYASSYGSTQEVAEVVAATLREQGGEVDLRPIREVRTLAGYSAVVLGAPLYMFHWHKDARRFLSRYQSVLTGGLPIAIFAGGPFGTGDEQAVARSAPTDSIRNWLSFPGSSRSPCS